MVGGTGAPWQKQLAAFVVFAAGNIGLNYFNSWALHKATDTDPNHPGFEFPYFYTMWHMLASSLAALTTALGSALGAGA